MRPLTFGHHKHSRQQSATSITSSKSSGSSVSSEAVPGTLSPRVASPLSASTPPRSPQGIRPSARHSSSYASERDHTHSSRRRSYPHSQSPHTSRSPSKEPAFAMPPQASAIPTALQDLLKGKGPATPETENAESLASPSLLGPLIEEDENSHQLSHGTRPSHPAVKIDAADDAASMMTAVSPGVGEATVPANIAQRPGPYPLGAGGGDNEMTGSLAALSEHGVIYEQGLMMRQHVLGEKYVTEKLRTEGSRFGLPMQTFATELAWGTIWTRPGLDLKTRSLLCLAMLTALGRWPELATHVRGAIRNGCSETEIQEALLQASAYCGLPSGFEAFRTAEAVLDELKAGDMADSVDAEQKR